VKYELGFYIPEDGILHSHRREDLKCLSVSHSISAQSPMAGWPQFQKIITLGYHRILSTAEPVPASQRPEELS
jgi:hypothetical protein